MKFKLDHAHWRTDEETKKKYEVLGFKYKYDNENNWYSGEPWMTIRPDEVDIEINSLEELIEFVKKWGPIVLNEDNITIYDDYLE